MCRENPDRARELILTLSAYYRQTLENDQYMLNLHTELYHVSSYLELEQARFEEKLQVSMDVEDDLNCPSSSSPWLKTRCATALMPKECALFPYRPGP